MSRVNIKAELKRISSKNLNGQEKFLVLAVLLSDFSKDKIISTKLIEDNWKKSLLNIKFNYTYYDRAQAENWVLATENGRGKFQITSEGIKYFHQFHKWAMFPLNRLLEFFL